ncbi:MAG: hypothetical protein ACTHJK_04535 [Sphingomicrobium sp.]
MSLLFDAPLIAGLRYEENVFGVPEEQRLIDYLAAADLSPVPLPRLARQPQDSDLRLALRFRGY